MSNLYLNALELASDSAETGFILSQKRTCYKGIYPFKLFPQKELSRVDFAPVTIFYGGNGSGKTTLLNVIAQAVGAHRGAAFSGSAFFKDYVSLCRVQTGEAPAECRILTSDDVSDYLLDLRALNDGVDRRREALLQDYQNRKWSALEFHSLADYDQWKEGYDAKRRTSSRFVNDRLEKNPDLFSNGETAIKYYVDRIGENSLYLIDEPENSLSAAFQQELAGFLADSARFFGCQLIIATHSPFLLAIPGARIYDLDSRPAEVRKWTQLENVRAYFDFFQKHQQEF